jgi:hypothetical protein
MARYKIGIIDDEYDKRVNIYQQILGCDEFEFEHISEKALIENRDVNNALGKYNAIMVDVWLAHHKQLKAIKDVLAIIKGLAPVIFVSSEWANKSTLHQVFDFQASKHSTKQIFAISLAELIQGNESKPATKDGHDVSNHAASIRYDLLQRLDQFYLKSSYYKDPSDDFHLLHLSDPQFGDKAFDSESFLMEDALFKLFKESDTNVDFIIITGDITYSGKPYEFNLAKKWIEKLIRRVWRIPQDESTEHVKDRILLVPGNHDVDLDIMSSMYYKFDFKAGKHVKREDNLYEYKQKGLASFREFAFEVTNDERWRSHNDLCWINNSFLHLGLRFFLLNTVAAIDCTEKQNFDRASVPREAIERLADQSLWSDKNVFSIAIAHHGEEKNGVKGIDNWDEIAAFFYHQNVKLFLHGHGHDNYSCALDMGKNSNYKLIQSMAQSSHLEKRAQSADSLRGFSIVVLKKENGDMISNVEIAPYEFRKVRGLSNVYEPRKREDEPYEFNVK